MRISLFFIQLHFEGFVLLISLFFATRVYLRRRESGFLFLLLAIAVLFLARFIRALAFSVLDTPDAKMSWLSVALPLENNIAPVLGLVALILLSKMKTPNQPPEPARPSGPSGPS